MSSWGGLAPRSKKARDGLVLPLLARAGSTFNVAAFGSAVACNRLGNTQTTSARCTQRHAALRMPVAGRTCAELGRLALRHRQARDGLVLPLLSRADSNSHVAAFGSAVACNRLGNKQTTSARCTQRHAALRISAAGRACAELGRLASRARQARGGLVFISPRPCWLMF